MTAERIRALESVGFKVEATVVSWNKQFEKLCEFKVQSGHCLVPQRYAANPKLGQWVSEQRKIYRVHQEGKPSPMTEERLRALESVGFDWGTRKTDLSSIWKVQFQQLCEYNAQFGNCSVPATYPANPKLGLWASKQRRSYRLHQEGMPSALTSERLRALDDIGFVGATGKTDLASIWSARLQQMREFKVQFGHCLVPMKYSEDPKLGKWVSNLRSIYRLHQEGNPSPMTEERIRELESLGFDWGTSKTDCTWKDSQVPQPERGAHSRAQEC